MSLSWRNQMRIGLGPDRLVVARQQRGLRPAAPTREIIAVEPREEGASWRAAVEALPSALALGGTADPAVTVVLSNHFVRYTLLPWIPELRTDDEWLALARHRLALVHGAAAEEWVVRCSETAPRGTRVACAVDRALIDAVNESVSGQGHNLVSVQPYLMAAFNHIRATIGDESGWVVIQEPGRLTLALIQDGAWIAIRSRRADGDWRAQLPGILEREGAMLALSRPCERVLVYTQDTFETGPDGAFYMRGLPEGAGVDERRFAMVLV